MRFGLAVGFLVLAACSSLEEPRLQTYDAIRAAVAQASDPSGAVTVSSEPAARVVTEYDPTLIGDMDETGLGSGPGGSTRSTKTMFVEGRKAAGGEVAIDIVRVREVRVSKGAADDAPAELSGLDAEGRIGAKWRTVYRRPTTYAHTCPPDRPYCLRRIVDRLVLANEDVRALLSEDGNEIAVSFWYWKNVDWRLDKDELTAVLDALGVRERFQPAS